VIDGKLSLLTHSIEQTESQACGPQMKVQGIRYFACQFEIGDAFNRWRLSEAYA
jgi:hypothetical protein